VISAGFVGLSESQAAQETAARDKWNAMIDATGLDVMKASDLVNGVANRPGPWDETDSADMTKASALYAGVADAVAKASAPSRLDWYRAAMAKNFRDAAAIAHDYSLMTAASSPTEFEALDNRWKARLEDALSLSERFQAQEKTAP
jgi:hypothetical protein